MPEESPHYSPQDESAKNNKPVDRSASQENTASDRLLQEVARYIADRHSMPIVEALGEGIRLVSRLHFADALPASIYRDVDTVAYYPPNEWPDELAASFESGRNTGVDKRSLDLGWSAGVHLRTIVDLIGSQEPSAPLSVAGVKEATGVAKGLPPELTTYLQSRYQALKALDFPENLRSLVWLDASSHAAVSAGIFRPLERLLVGGVQISTPDPEQYIRGKLHEGVRSLGYHRAVRTYTDAREDRFQPTHEIPHPLGLWRAVMRLQFTNQDFSVTNYKMWIARRAAILRELRNFDYMPALEKLTRMEEDFPGMVSLHWLQRATGGGDADADN